MTVAGVAAMAAAIVLFVIGFHWHPDSRARARLNVATILLAYAGLVAALSARLA